MLALVLGNLFILILKISTGMYIVIKYVYIYNI